MSYSSAYNIEDLRRLAQCRLPRVAWDYLERGAEDDVTMTANRAAFERIHFEPRTLVDVSARTLRHRLFGKTYTAPFGIAPTGAAGLYSFEADIALARAAAQAGVTFVLSTASFVAMERVAREAEGSKWFQLYMSKDREASERLVRRVVWRSRRWRGRCGAGAGVAAQRNRPRHGADRLQHGGGTGSQISASAGIRIITAFTDLIQ